MNVTPVSVEGLGQQRVCLAAAGQSQEVETHNSAVWLLHGHNSYHSILLQRLHYFPAVTATAVYGSVVYKFLSRPQLHDAIGDRADNF